MERKEAVQTKRRKKIGLKTRIVYGFAAAVRYLRGEAKKAKRNRELGIWVLLDENQKLKTTKKGAAQ